MTKPVKELYLKRIVCAKCHQPATLYRPNGRFCSPTCKRAAEQKRRRLRKKNLSADAQ